MRILINGGGIINDVFNDFQVQLFHQEYQENVIATKKYLRPFLVAPPMLSALAKVSRLPSRELCVIFKPNLVSRELFVIFKHNLVSRELCVILKPNLVSKEACVLYLNLFCKKVFVTVKPNLVYREVCVIVEPNLACI